MSELSMPRPQRQDRWEVSESLRRETFEFARELRRRQTRSEQLLWDVLRGRKLDGVKFRRQCPIGPFIVDFCAPSLRLVIEIDGGVHETQKEQDSERQEAIELLGFQFIRVSADRVENNLLEVCDEIRQMMWWLAE